MGILFPEINPNIHNSGPVVVWKYFIYLFKYTQYDIKKLFYKNMRCWEEDSDSCDDCKGGEYYQTEPAVIKGILCDFWEEGKCGFNAHHILQ